MVFPVTFDLGPVHVPAHLVFELLAYVVAFRLYAAFRRKWGDDRSRPALAGP